MSYPTRLVVSTRMTSSELSQWMGRSISLQPGYLAFSSIGFFAGVDSSGMMEAADNRNLIDQKGQADTYAGFVMLSLVPLIAICCFVRRSFMP
jgi:hypothetical protein